MKRRRVFKPESAFFGLSDNEASQRQRGCRREANMLRHAGNFDALRV
jgi:hypothetical protein